MNTETKGKEKLDIMATGIEWKGRVKGRQIEKMFANTKDIYHQTFASKRKWMTCRDIREKEEEGMGGQKRERENHTVSS